MKRTVLLCCLLSVAALAVDPGPTPADAGQDKVEQIQNSGGALKVEKTPAHIEGMTPPPVEKDMKAKIPKKKRRIDQPKVEKKTDQ